MPPASSTRRPTAPLTMRPLARAYDLCVMHTSTPSFAADVKVAAALKAENPGLSIGMVGAAVAVAPEAR